MLKTWKEKDIPGIQRRGNCINLGNMFTQSRNKFLHLNIDSIRLHSRFCTVYANWLYHDCLALVLETAAMIPQYSDQLQYALSLPYKRTNQKKKKGAELQIRRAWNNQGFQTQGPTLAPTNQSEESSYSIQAAQSHLQIRLGWNWEQLGHKVLNIMEEPAKP